jgi:hypothetical protein
VLACSPRAGRCSAQASIPTAGCSTWSTSRRRATGCSTSRSAGCCAAPRPRRSMSTSGCRTPRPRCAHSTACAGTCPCSARWRPTHRCGTGATRGWRARARCCSAATAARRSRARSTATTTTPRRSRPPWRPVTCPTTRSCGGTCGPIRGWARSRSAAWTPSSRCPRSPGCRRSSRRSPGARPIGHSPWAPREAIVEASFAAHRDGLDARLPLDGRLRPARELVAATLAVARPYARELGTEAALDEVERIVAEGNGADRQRAAHARGGMPALLAWLAQESGRPYG